MDTMSGDRHTAETLKCAKCGWVWMKRRGQDDPKRCPNAECRTKKWKVEVGGAYSTSDALGMEEIK